MASAADVLSTCAVDMRSPLRELHARVAENDAVANDDEYDLETLYLHKFVFA